MNTDLIRYFEPLEVAVPAILEAVRCGNLAKASLISRSVSVFLGFLETIDTDIMNSDAGDKMKLRTLSQLREIEQLLHQCRPVPRRR